MGSIKLALDRVKWLIVVGSVMNVWIPEFLNDVCNCRLSKKGLHNTFASYEQAMIKLSRVHSKKLF